MYKKGDILTIRTPEELDGFKYLMFTEDAHTVNGNPLKYMGAARPVCDGYYRKKDSMEGKTYCQGCRYHCPERQYMVKYVGDFSGTDEPVKKTSVRQKQAATANHELDNLIRQKKNGARQENQKQESDLEREKKLLANQAAVRIVSPFLMQTILDGHDKCGKTEIDYVVLEYVPGQELDGYIASLKNMDDQQEADRRRLDLIRQLLYAVRSYAKQSGVGYYVHRDLKPANILVCVYDEDDFQQRLKLIDFDMMVEQNNIRFHNLYMGGTVGYVHPEAYRWKDLPEELDRQFSHRWDLYAVGLLMYEIMEGRAHFDEEERYLDDPEKAYRLKPMSSGKRCPGLEAIIRKLISNDESGYQDVDDVIRDYQQFLEDYNPNWSVDYYMGQWLECRPGYDRQLPFVNVYCCVTSQGLKDCRQSFCVSDNTVLTLTYGKNIIGHANLTGRTVSGERPVQAVIGSFCYTGDNLHFIPLSGECQVSRDSKTADSEDDSQMSGTKIIYQDVVIQIEKVVFY